jgi:hypothetical protein
MSKDRAQPPNVIQNPGDVEPFDFTKVYGDSVDPALRYAQTVMNDLGVPYIFITTPKIGRTDKEDGTSTVQSSHVIRVNNLNLVRDFALMFAHAAVAAENHTALGQRVAELGLKSKEFMDAFCAVCENAGYFTEVTVEEEESSGSLKPPLH